MSHCTLNEKLDLLYDIFDSVDGSCEGLKTNQAFEIIKTIFERCLYFWPSHELYNQIEQVFYGSISSVYKAYWTKDISKLTQFDGRYEITLQDLIKSKPNQIDFDEEGVSVELSHEVQEAFSQYFTLFGTKVVDFNLDVTPYSNMRNLIGKDKAEKLLEATANTKDAYQLCLFSSLHGERFIYIVNFDNQTGQLISTGSLDDKSMNTFDVDSISSYFSRSKNCLDLQGANKKITKQQFQQKVEEIPMLANFIRVETLFRDKEVADTISFKTKLKIPIFCTFTLQEYVFNFEFYHRRIAI